MSKNIAVGIDIGTYHVKVIVARRNKKGGLPKIIGTGYAQSSGLRYGYIVNSSECVRSIKKAVRQAEESAGISIEKGYLGLGVVSLEGITATGTTVISRGDNTITEYDIDNAIESAEKQLPESEMVNREVLESIPRRFRVDGKEVLGRAEGMKGIKLESEILFITSLKQHLHDLVQAVEKAGVEVQGVVPSPLAASEVTLTKAQKIAGCVLANIGSETVSIIVYDNNMPVSIAVLPIGSTDITNDIALGLNISLEEAEQIKLGGITGTQVSRKKLNEIIQARLTDIFELIESHLESIGKKGMLPAGIIITGGGSGVTTIEDMAKATLDLPSKIADVKFANNPKLGIKDPSWAVAYGLTIYGFNDDASKKSTSALFKNAKRTFFSWIKRFLP